MTRRASKLTPQAMLGAPRRSGGLPNADASQVLFIESSWSWEQNEWLQKKLCLLDVLKQEVHVLLEHKSLLEASWLDAEGSPHPSVVLVLVGDEEDNTELLLGQTDHWHGKTSRIGKFDGPVSNLKVMRADADTFALCFSGWADVNGSLYNSKKAAKPVSSGRLYRSTFVRHWDYYIAPQRQSIFYCTLGKSNDAWAMSKTYNALPSTTIESPMPPFGASDHFDISKKGILFVARDPAVAPAFSTKCNLYFVPLKSFSSEPDEVLQISVPGHRGAMTSPVFSRSGKQAAFLSMRGETYEADQNHIFVIPDTGKPDNLVKHAISDEWILSPSSVQFSHDERTLLLKAEQHGRVLLFSAPVHANRPTSLPKVLTDYGSISAVQSLPDDRVFCSGSSFTEPCFYALLSGLSLASSSSDLQCDLVFSTSQLYNLAKGSVTSIHTPASSKHMTAVPTIHSFVLLPPDFSRAKRYPLALLIHGGPQSAWNESWSTRWNPQVFADQGYVVVCPNFTGSTGYGQKFVDAITDNWGSYPYEDLVNVFDHVRNNMPFVDTDRAVAAGGSYGGYMINWMQGNELGRRFKAMVCHDGVFSSSYHLATDEVYFVNHDYAGSWSANRERWVKWDPAQRTQHWRTPQLVVHGERDHRIGVTDGLATFNVLQERGVESELLVFPDENHWVLSPRNSLKWHQAVFGFLNRHVGLPEYMPEDLKGIVMDPEKDTQGSSKIRIMESSVSMSD